MDKKSLLAGFVIGVFVTFGTLKSAPPAPAPLPATPGSRPTTTPNLQSTSTPPPKPTPTPNPRDFAQISDVLPTDYRLSVSFGDVVVKMVQAGAIDKARFIELYESRKPLSAEQKRLLDAPSYQPIIVNQENAGLLLNLLWPLGISNKSAVLSKGPMGAQYSNEIGNFASTGGWDLGKKGGGELFNRLALVKLTPQQENLVQEIAQHIYRPCCGNHTAFPDCNHGAAMLGFIELAVSQGLPTNEIYRQALVLNAYWFPQTYAELAIYFKVKRNRAWTSVDPKEALGEKYSSGRGYEAINKELQADGLLPKVDEGGSCGT
ncbi:MAG: hypothetical protein M1546_18305 [Chloroflexi bacterium]|nr:hypothetical protein [Chloroflexota bacterium]